MSYVICICLCPSFIVSFCKAATVVEYVSEAPIYAALCPHLEGTIVLASCCYETDAFLIFDLFHSHSITLLFIISIFKGGQLEETSLKESHEDILWTLYSNLIEKSP